MMLFRNTLRSGSTNYVHITRDYGVTFEELAPLPLTDHDSKAFFLDENTVLYQPMRSSQYPFYLLDLETNTWSEGLRLKYQRRFMQLGMITRSSGEKELVFVGGIADGGSEKPADALECQSRCGQYRTKSVEIYNIATNTLREGMYRPQISIMRLNM